MLPLFFSVLHPLPHLLFVSYFLSQAHGSGGPEKLHLLAESERRGHSVCCAGLRHVQSASQTAMMRQHETSSPLVPVLTLPLSYYLKDSKRLAEQCLSIQLHLIPVSQHEQETNEQNISTFCMHLKKKKCSLV